MDAIVGIDLGTTISVLSYINPNDLGTPKVLIDEKGISLVPSKVCFEDNKIRVHKNNCSGAEVKEFKREIGHNDYYFEFNGKKYDSTELSSFVLKYLKENAEEQGLVINDVVISVPAYFDEIKRNSTKKAGELAGLNVLEVINEPTAAALYYSTSMKLDGKVLVFDLGGGTFDLTIMNINGSDIDVIASGGDAQLGGMDFDKSMFNLILEKYIKVAGSGVPYEDDDDKNELINEVAEEIKKALSSENSVEKRFRGSKGKFNVIITREDFENKINEHLDNIEGLIDLIMEEKKLKYEDINHIILAGGSTRIPIIKEIIKNLFSKEPIISTDVDEAVAKGTALRAAMLRVRKNPDSVSSSIVATTNKLNISEVATVSFGTIALDKDTDIRKNNIIIKKGTKIPCSKSSTFSTVSYNQMYVDFEITTGESTKPKEVTIVDKFTLELPGDRPEGQIIEVTYSYTGDQSLKCKAVDISSGRVKEYTSNKVL